VWFLKGKRYLLQFLLSALLLLVVSFNVFALTPYKIEFEELPIKVYSDETPSIYGDIIAYRSDRNEISIYNLDTDEIKIISNTDNSVSNAVVYGNYVLYDISYRGISELVKHDLASGKTNIIMPSGKYFVRNNILIAYIDCDRYPSGSGSECINSLPTSSHDDRVNLMDLTKNIDFPFSGLDKCEIGENQFLNTDNPHKTLFTPSNPKESVKCKVCDAITGEIAFLDESECNIEDDEEEFSLSNLDSNENKLIFDDSNGKYYLKKAVFGDLKEICKSHITESSKDGFNAKNICELGDNNICNCEYILTSEDSKFSNTEEYTFNLINSDDDTFSTAFNQMLINVNSKVSEYNKKLLGEEEQELLEEKREATKKQSFILIIILVVLSPFAFYFTKSYLRKKRLEEERIRTEQGKNRKLAEEKRRKEQENEDKRIREENKRKELYEKKQISKGLVIHMGKWGTQKEIKRWKDEEYKKSLPYLIQKEIESFKPSRNWGTEEGYQGELQGWIKTKFPNSQVEIQRGRSRPDIVIGEIAIEVKGPTGSNELSSIADKCMRYALHFEHLIIVLFDVRVSHHLYQEWLQALKKQHPKVVVIKI